MAVVNVRAEALTYLEAKTPIRQTLPNVLCSFRGAANPEKQATAKEEADSLRE
jgi:hypothetical protein